MEVVQLSVLPGKVHNAAVPHLKVGCEEGIGIALSHKFSDFASKNMMHNAGALLKVVQPRQQGLDGSLGVLRVQLLYFFIRHF